MNKAGAEDGKQYLLTIASGASQRYADHTELKKISQILDWINIMTYDFHGGWEATSNHNALYIRIQMTQRNTNFYVDGAINVYTNEGVPVDKLVLGVPFTDVAGKVVAKKIMDNINLANQVVMGNLLLKVLGMIILPVTRVCMITVI